MATPNWLPFPVPQVEVSGLPWFRETQPTLARLPSRWQHLLPDPPWHTRLAPSGARLRLATDSTTFRVRLRYDRLRHFYNLSAMGQMGVDLYVDGDYWASAAPKGAGILDACLFEELPPRLRQICLYLPLYHPVELLALGLDPEARIAPAEPFCRAKPVVFYGSSITQGGCVSRSGLSYPAVLCRGLGLDFVNLGFTGEACGQPEMAAALAEIDAAAYVLDFAQNLTTPEELAAVYAPFLQHLREARPDTPILCVSPLFVARERYWPPAQERLEGMRLVIRDCVHQRAAEDAHLWLAEGLALLGAAEGECLTDGVHPGDHGAYLIAQRLTPILAAAVGLPSLPVSDAVKCGGHTSSLASRSGE